MWVTSKGLPKIGLKCVTRNMSWVMTVSHSTRARKIWKNISSAHRNDIALCIQWLVIMNLIRNVWSQLWSIKSTWQLWLLMFHVTNDDEYQFPFLECLRVPIPFLGVVEIYRLDWIYAFFSYKTVESFFPSFSFPSVPLHRTEVCCLAC